MDTAPSRGRRITATVLSLIVPGAGHFLLGAFRRGAAGAVGLALIGFLLLFAMPVSLLTFTALLALAVGIGGRIAMAVDTARLTTPRPAWKLVVIGWAALLAVDVVVVDWVKQYYRTHHAQAFTIPAGSMQPALLVGDYVMVDKSAYRDRAPQRGDIVVFPYPPDERRTFIKRVVALPGEQILIREHRLTVNGRPLAEPYVATAVGVRQVASACDYAFGCEPITVPADSYFLLGDNRDNSQDSRYWGFVRRDKIMGRVVTIYWSWDRERSWPRFDRIGRAP
jgi:signal peptidase I